MHTMKSLFCLFILSRIIEKKQLFPQFLNDGNLYDRETGMVMGLAMLTKCAEVWVFGDNHTPGMRREIKKAKLKHIPIRYFDTDCQEVTA